MECAVISAAASLIGHCPCKTKIVNNCSYLAVRESEVYTYIGTIVVRLLRDVHQVIGAKKGIFNLAGPAPCAVLRKLMVSGLN